MTKKVIKLENVHFNVRRYAANVAYKDQQILSEQDQISLGIVCDPENVPAEMQGSEFVVPYEDKEGKQKMRAKIKIGVLCEWYNEKHKRIDKPLNADLEAKQWEAYVRFVEKARNPNNDKAPSGFWANSIMLREKPTDPFAGCGFDDVPSAAVNPAPIEAEAEAEPVAEPVKKDPDLPF